MIMLALSQRAYQISKDRLFWSPQTMKWTKDSFLCPALKIVTNRWWFNVSSIIFSLYPTFHYENKFLIKSAYYSKSHKTLRRGAPKWKEHINKRDSQIRGSLGSFTTASITGSPGIIGTPRHCMPACMEIYLFQVKRSLDLNTRQYYSYCLDILTHFREEYPHFLFLLLIFLLKKGLNWAVQ